MKEINHQFGNLRVMAFKCEMSAGYEMDFGIRQVALEGFGTFRDERRVVLSPDSQQWGLFQYSLRASHFLPSPSSYMLPFWEMMAVMRSGCHMARR